MAKLTPSQTCQLNNIRQFLAKDGNVPRLIEEQGKPGRYKVEGMPGVTVESSVKRDKNGDITSSSITYGPPNEAVTRSVTEQGGQVSTKNTDEGKPSIGGHTGSFPTAEGLRFDEAMKTNCTQVLSNRHRAKSSAAPA